MKFFVIVAALIALGLAALFLIKHSGFWLIVTIIAIIAGFWAAVFQIPKEEEEA